MWLKNVRYLDYNAGSGLSQTVQDKLISLLKDDAVFLANPSSRHRLGQRISHLLYQSKLSIAASLSAFNTPLLAAPGKTPPSLGASTLNSTPAEEIADGLLFTSSGTEANQTVIRSHRQAILVGAAEHSASLDILPSLEKSRPWVRILPLLPSGHYDLQKIPALLDEIHALGLSEILISLGWANNETGVLLDLNELHTILKNSPVKAFIHLDGAQVWGKIPVNVVASGAHYVTFSGHKIGAPAGVGLIWKRSNAPLVPLIPSSQQKGMRGGTENSLGIIALGVAASELNPPQFAEHTGRLRDRLESRLKGVNAQIKFWGEKTARIANTSRIGLTGFQKYENWVELLDVKGFAVSHGSACKSEVIEPSHVLLAMGASREEAVNSIRVSLGLDNTIEEIDEFVDTLLTMIQAKSALLTSRGSN